MFFFLVEGVRPIERQLSPIVPVSGGKQLDPGQASGCTSRADRG
jgi:hypothetical protein